MTWGRRHVLSCLRIYWYGTCLIFPIRSPEYRKHDILTPFIFFHFIPVFLKFESIEVLLAASIQTEKLYYERSPIRCHFVSSYVAIIPSASQISSSPSLFFLCRSPDYQQTVFPIPALPRQSVTIANCRRLKTHSDFFIFLYCTGKKTKGKAKKSIGTASRNGWISRSSAVSERRWTQSCHSKFLKILHMFLKFPLSVFFNF